MEGRTWARIKLDALVHQDEQSARVIDYKTGKKWGNEISHSQQALLYAIGTFLRYPDLEFVNSRAVKMTTETEFNPTPSKSSCRWCSYRQGDDPQCQWGVS